MTVIIYSNVAIFHCHQVIIRVAFSKLISKNEKYQQMMHCLFESKSRTKPIISLFPPYRSFLPCRKLFLFHFFVDNEGLKQRLVF